MNDPTDAIVTLRERFRESEAITDADTESLIAFSDELEFRASEYFNLTELAIF